MSDRPCTCHPDDNPPVPCPQKFALSECRAAAPAPICFPKCDGYPNCWCGQRAAAPAPEPVAWALQHKHGLAFEFVGFIQPTREKAEEMQRRHFGNPAVVPLYTHPVPVAAPAPDVDKIMALVSQVIGPMLQAELRSEVERLAQRAERAELDAAIGAALQDKTT